MKFAVHTILPSAILLTVSSLAGAQEVDAFLACAGITDRDQRLACLDEALDAATTRQEDASAEPADSPAAVESFGEAPGRVAETPDVGESADQESFFRLPRIGIFRRGDDARDSAEEEAGEAVAESGSGDSEADRLESFGREARIVVNADGEDELHDSIAELLMARPNQWLIRLASGQVWEQVHPKRLNLREGDEVRIYPTGWGDNFRLETPRLDGYIQVLRVEE